MSLTTNQSLELPDGTDNANVPLAMTNYNAGIEGRTVQRYLSVADRTARNAAPSEGEMSYLSDSDIYQTYQTALGWINLLPAYAFSTDTPIFNTASTVFTTAGAPVVGQTIVAPPSGILRVGWASYIDNSSTTEQSLIGPQLNTGAVIGGGAAVVAVSDNVSARAYGGLAVQSSSFYRYTGLTPGSSYNAFLMHRATGSSASFANRVLELEQK